MRQPDRAEPPIDLQALFAEPILAWEALSPGYADHANDVFAVRTARRHVIVRLPRTEYAASDPFWWGCFELFGIRLGSADQLAAINTALSCATNLAVPHVDHTGRWGGRPYVILTHLSGEQIHDFRQQPPALLEQLGRELAAIHEARFPEFGTVTTERRDDLANFPERLATTLERLANRFYRDAPDIQAVLPGFAAAARRLPPPVTASLVMIDLDPSQFLAKEDRLTAMIDTEAYALGPRELEFIGLELVVDAPAAAAIARGYQTRLPLPELAIVRPVYRFLYRLLEVQGAIPLAELLAMPAYF